MISYGCVSNKEYSLFYIICTKAQRISLDMDQPSMNSFYLCTVLVEQTQLSLPFLRTNRWRTLRNEPSTGEQFCSEMKMEKTSSSDITGKHLGTSYSQDNT
jgi:hypothetical protein